MVWISVCGGPRVKGLVLGQWLFWEVGSHLLGPNNSVLSAIQMHCCEMYTYAQWSLLLPPIQFLCTYSHEIGFRLYPLCVRGPSY